MQLYSLKQNLISHLHKNNWSCVALNQYVPVVISFPFTSVYFLAVFIKTIGAYFWFLTPKTSFDMIVIESMFATIYFKFTFFSVLFITWILWINFLIEIFLVNIYCLIIKLSPRKDYFLVEKTKTKFKSERMKKSIFCQDLNGGEF